MPFTARAIRTDAVENAVRAVPRHLFAPEASLVRAYAPEDAVITKRDENGVALSSVSAARIQAFMLEQAEVRPGMRVLEIGSGDYNAALIAELVGEDGQVTSIDIDPEVIGRARRLLDEAGYERVTTLVADGELGAPEQSPFDRIIVAVGAWDIPPAWFEQLTDEGRIVVPLRVRGLTRSVAFERNGDHLVSRDYELCGFVPMQGAGENRVQLVLLHTEKEEEEEEVGLRRWSAGGRGPAARRPGSAPGRGVVRGHRWRHEALRRPRSVAGDTPAGPPLLTGTVAARDRGLVASASPLGVSTLVDGASFAYRTVRPTNPERALFEFGAYGHGPDAQKAAERLIEEIQTWDRDQRSHHARYQAHPVGTPGAHLAVDRVIDKRHTRVTISWPTRQQS
ncbi:methyltransferase, FxLD system [Streptomyces sp. NBC_01803]|uniref:methyltransferase, FxLD system n=1 Tax=Streptomyces sp. NBC_01803 TaxID=2975946 RepID=UPI002DD7A110|nr:methyltransferase, FxLD system [Streptomyces sp. NBC_01803]WSA45453.1 methyltransferase, FxLD system [Streptomyces sp. NBC_01803]